jgi:carbon monoxide dehydrogenase subunit G
MWEATVRVDRAVPVAAAPDRAWSLLCSPQAWSARPRGCVTFDLTDPLENARLRAGAGPLRLYLAAGATRAYATVLEVTAQEPGRLISLQTEGGRATWTLSVEAGRRGPALRVAATSMVDRPAKIDAESMLQREVKGWLARLRDIAEDRLPWPGDGMPESLRQVCQASPPPGPAVDASASAQIDVPPGIVQSVIARPDFIRQIQPAGVAYAAPVPGTPGQGVVGSMHAFVTPRADGLLAALVSLYAASSPDARMHRLVTAPFYETTYRYEPAGDGTRLEVTRRCPGHRAASQDEHAGWHAAGVAAIAEQYKVTVERLARAPG